MFILKILFILSLLHSSSTVSSESLENKNALCIDDTDNLSSKSLCNKPDLRYHEPDMVLMFLTLTSIGLLALTISTYLYLPLLLNIHGKVIVCHLVCLMLSYIIQTIQYFVHPGDQILGETSIICFALGIGFYATSLSALFWLCLINHDIWKTFTQKASEDITDVQKRFRNYCIVGFGSPILLSCIVTILEFTVPNDSICKPGIGVNTFRCFFSTTSGYSIILYYYGITAVMIVVNLAIFTRTNIVLCRIQSVASKARKSSTASPADLLARLFLFFKLFCVMGTAWIINIALWSVDHDVLSPGEKSWTARFFECFNVMHGVCYFIIFVCKPSIFKMLRNKMNSTTEDSILISSRENRSNSNPKGEKQMFKSKS